MPYIELGNDSPRILGLFRYRLETGRLMSEMVEVLLRGPSPLTPDPTRLKGRTGL
ncbi:hypothetical protein [Actinoallomurus sp. NPDC050550]|uniref:hypothetical protein n=1 Tax=Actinoallomurus sp. NPDC050550 TaxID=3154937 RepID=UPI0033F666C2